MRQFNWDPEKKASNQRGTFSPLHIKDAIVTTFKKRPGPNRKFILLLFALILVSALYGRSGAGLGYLYVRTRYGWEVEEFSLYKSIDSAVTIIGKKTDLSHI